MGLAPRLTCSRLSGVFNTATEFVGAGRAGWFGGLGELAGGVKGAGVVFGKLELLGFGVGLAVEVTTLELGLTDGVIIGVDGIESPPVYV